MTCGVTIIYYTYTIIYYYYYYYILSYTILFFCSIPLPLIPYPHLLSSSFPFFCSLPIFSSLPFLLPSSNHSPPNLSSSFPIYLLLLLIQSIRVGTYIRSFISNRQSTIRPRMFYRSGWLRCDVFNYVVFCFVLSWCDGLSI